MRPLPFDLPAVASVERPSTAEFDRLKQDGHPVLITGCLDAWPLYQELCALSSVRDKIEYLRAHATGERVSFVVLPAEAGGHLYFANGLNTRPVLGNCWASSGKREGARTRCLLVLTTVVGRRFRHDLKRLLHKAEALGLGALIALKLEQREAIRRATDYYANTVFGYPIFGRPSATIPGIPIWTCSRKRRMRL